jgi:hypothetical protein
MTVRRWERCGWRRKVLVSLAIVGVLTVGACNKSDRTEVRGRVTRADGTPLVGAKVTFRSSEAGVTAIGYTDQDGYYSLQSTDTGEGLPRGTYGVAINEDRGSEENIRPMTIHPKYVAASRSGIQLAVPPGEGKNYDIVVEAPR